MFESDTVSSVTPVLDTTRAMSVKVFKRSFGEHRQTVYCKLVLLCLFVKFETFSINDMSSTTPQKYLFNSLVSPLVSIFTVHGSFPRPAFSYLSNIFDV